MFFFERDQAALVFLKEFNKEILKRWCWNIYKDARGVSFDFKHED